MARIPTITIERPQYEKLLAGEGVLLPGEVWLDFFEDLREELAVERSLAYERCCEIIRSQCMRMECAPDARVWFYVDRLHAPSDDLGAALSYLTNRNLIEWMQEGSEYFNLCDEDEPMKEDEDGK